MNDILYDFNDENFFEVAMTHTSYAKEKGLKSKERLEFLGDSVLSFSVAEDLFNRFPDYDEGKLTILRSRLVCEKTLAKLAKKINLDKFLKIGKSEQKSGGIAKPSILADTFEALLGAIFLDSGIETAKKWALDMLASEPLDEDFKDYKSILHVHFQKKCKTKDAVAYILKEQRGPDHSPTFVVDIYCEGEYMGEGVGRSHKDAEQNAAKKAYAIIFKDKSEDEI
jgi:ribonuclease-3